MQSDGASAIHSAEVRSGAGMAKLRVMAVPRLRFFSSTTTRPSMYATAPRILLPGATASLSSTGGSGTSSIQA
jgi:hypothetical protein